MRSAPPVGSFKRQRCHATQPGLFVVLLQWLDADGCVCVLQDKGSGQAGSALCLVFSTTGLLSETGQ